LKKILTILRNLLFIGLGFFLFWLVYRGINLGKLFNDLKNAHYGWVLLGLFIAMFGHLARALRWKMLVGGIGYNIKTSRAFIAVLINYMANVAVPRAGEVSRPLVISKTDGAPLSKLIGTIIIERLFDMITLLTITFIAIIIEFKSIKDTLYHYLHLSQSKIVNYITLRNVFFIIFIILALIIALFLIKKSKRAFKQHFLYLRIKGIISGFWSGIKSIWVMKNKWAFILYTLAIWCTYFMMTYLVFFAVDATSHLGLREALFVLTVSSLGFILPSPGGIGTYHAAAVIALGFYNISVETSQLYAFIAHTSQTLLVLIAGAVAYIVFLVMIKNQKKKDESLSNR